MKSSSNETDVINDIEGKTQDNGKRKKLPFWRMMLSVMQASFGVQNRANKERDFEHGSVGGFIAAALIFTFIFVVALVLIVRQVLS